MSTVTAPPSHPTRTRRFWPAARSVLSVVLAVAALVLFLAWMGGAFREKAHPGAVKVEQPRAAGRTLVAVEKTRDAELTSVVGSVQPRRKTQVASQLLATVREVKVQPGDRVEPKQPLVVLDDRELLAQQREAVAALTAADADVLTRKAEFERQEKLRMQGSGSTDEYTRAEGTYKVAKAQVDRAREAIARIDIMITYTRINASSAGIVADRFVDPGDLATPGTRLLELYDPAELEFHAFVPESLAPAVAPGQDLPVHVDAADFHPKGRVREVVPQAQQLTRSVLMKLSLPPSPSVRPLLPGMFGRIEVPVGQAERLWVPREAVTHIGQLDLVEVENADGTLDRRFVRTGQVADGKVEILSGLAAGDRVALAAK